MELTVPAKALPRIVDYRDYRNFLGDFFVAKKSLRSGFSYRQFSGLCGLKSPNYLQLVIRKERRLTAETGRQIGRAMKLSAGELRYFLALIAEDWAETEDEKNKAEKEIYLALHALRARTIKKADDALFSHWGYFALRELVALKDFEPSGAYMSGKLGGLIPPEQTEKMFRALLDWGLLVLEGGTYRMKDPVLETESSAFQHFMMQKFHASTLQMWSKNIEALDSKRQELGLLNIPIPADKIPELRKKIQTFQNEIIGWAMDFKSNDELAQLGTYLMIFKEPEKGS